MHFICDRCGATEEIGTLAWRCRCAGLWELGGDLPVLPLGELVHRDQDLWRYRESLPVRDAAIWSQVSLGEGRTPLLALEPGTPQVRVKAEYVMPTLSFKDRGAVVLVANAAAHGHRSLVADSSGNAGTAVAAYAARAGIAAEVFVPDSTSPKKVAQIEAHGATVRRIPGSREDTAAAAVDAVESRSGVYYASHVYNPLFYTGTATYVLEVWEQLGGRLPKALVLPAGNGTLVLGVQRGVAMLVAQGAIAATPVLHAVQASGCEPLTEAFVRGDEDAAVVPTTETVAEGIAIAAPARGRAILAAVRTSGGRVVSVTDDEVRAARERLARAGLYVEPTAAAPLAALPALGPEVLDDVVLPLAGAGLKAS